MEKFFKKVQTALAVSLITVTGIVSAYDGGIGRGCGVPCSPCEQSCGRWSVDSDFLYWTACERGLTFGSKTEQRACSSHTSFETRKKHPHSRWDVGWRVGIGYQFPCDCWDATLTWTHFDTDGHAKHDENTSSTEWFTPAWNSIPGDGDVNGRLLGGRTTTEGGFPVDFAHGHWKLRLNLLDLEIGREYCVNSCLSLRPFVGVRGASINEKYNIEYATPLISRIGASTSDRDRVHLKNDFEGAGVRGGLDTDFDLGCGLSIYGGVAASLLYGETEIKSKEILVSSVTPVIPNPVTIVSCFEQHQKDHECGCRAITDAEIGIRWQKMCCNKMVVFQLGWEHHFFFNQNQFEKFTNYNGSNNFGTDRYPENVHGDLSVQGLVISTRIFF